MNDRKPTHDTDAQLRQQLRAITPPADASEALAARVMAQWIDRPSQSLAHGSPAAAAASASASTAGRRATRQRWWAAATAGVAAGAVVAITLWVQPADPLLDELMQTDVLSQMAIGEM